VAWVSANTWRWERTPQCWRIGERINASLDGTAAHRGMLAPPGSPGCSAPVTGKLCDVLNKKDEMARPRLS
jgi:hypothetical protein